MRILRRRHKARDAAAALEHKKGEMYGFFIKPLALYHSGYRDCDCHGFSGPGKEKTGR
jgi:hypothetical protein